MDLHTNMTVTLACFISVTDKIRTRVFNADVAWPPVMGGISLKSFHTRRGWGLFLLD